MWVINAILRIRFSPGADAEPLASMPIGQRVPRPSMPVTSDTTTSGRSEDQIEFVAWWEENVRNVGGNRRPGTFIVQDPGQWNVEQAEEMTGISQQIEFVAWWEENVQPHGGDRRSSARTVALDLMLCEQAEEMT